MTVVGELKTGVPLAFSIWKLTSMPFVPTFAMRQLKEFVPASSSGAVVRVAPRATPPTIDAIATTASTGRVSFDIAVLLPAAVGKASCPLAADADTVARRANRCKQKDSTIDGRLLLTRRREALGQTDARSRRVCAGGPVAADVQSFAVARERHRLGAPRTRASRGNRGMQLAPWRSQVVPKPARDGGEPR